MKLDADCAVGREATYRNLDDGDWAAEDIDLTTDGGAIVAVDDSTFGFLKFALFPDPDAPLDPTDLNDHG